MQLLKFCFIESLVYQFVKSLGGEILYESLTSYRVSRK